MTGTVAKDAPANYARHYRTMWKTALKFYFGTHGFPATLALSRKLKAIAALGFYDRR
jgi:hypothetical protein